MEGHQATSPTGCIKITRNLKMQGEKSMQDYQKLKDARGEEYARNNPLSYVKPEQWMSLIEKKWSVKKWQVITPPPLYLSKALLVSLSL